MIVLERLAHLATSWVAGVVYTIFGVPLGLFLSVGPFSVRTGLEIGAAIAIFGLGLIARSITGSWSRGFACLGLSGVLFGFAFAAGIFIGASDNSAHQGRLVLFYGLIAAGVFFVASPVVGFLNIRSIERRKTAAQVSIDTA